MNRIARTVVLGLFALGCASSQRPHNERHGPARAAEYFPLRAGAAWSFDTETGIGGDTVLNTLAVESTDGTAFVVRSGQRRERYEVRPDGVLREGTYLLHDPIRVGATWPSGDGSVSEVRAAYPSRRVGAVEYADVVEVHRVAARTRIETTTWYARDVGAIEIVGETVSSLGGRLHVRSTLRAFSRGDDAATAP